jgi:hypothetical protein
MCDIVYVYVCMCMCVCVCVCVCLFVCVFRESRWIAPTVLVFYFCSFKYTFFPLVSSSRSRTTHSNRCCAAVSEMPQDKPNDCSGGKAVGNAVTFLKEAQGLLWHFVCVNLGCIPQGAQALLRRVVMSPPARCAFFHTHTLGESTHFDSTRRFNGQHLYRFDGEHLYRFDGEHLYRFDGEHLYRYIETTAVIYLSFA